MVGLRKVALVLAAPLAGLLAQPLLAETPAFKVCESTYALCTTASCTPVPGKSDEVSCTCDVKTGYSVGLESCTQPNQTSQGTEIRSRYFPVKSYAACDNGRPWAWCLDKPCIVDANDPDKAQCACTAVKDQGIYVIVTDKTTPLTCSTGIISSATVEQLDQVTEFLKTSPDLKPFDIEVLAVPE